MSNIKAILKAIQDHSNMAYFGVNEGWQEIHAVADYGSDVICISNTTPIARIYKVKLRLLDPLSMAVAFDPPLDNVELLVGEKGGVFEAVNHYNENRPTEQPYIINFHLVDRSEELIPIGTNITVEQATKLADAYKRKDNRLEAVYEIAPDTIIRNGAVYKLQEMTAEDWVGIIQL